MIKYGLKLWSSNTDLLSDAVTAYSKDAFDFIELYCNPDVPLDWPSLQKIKGIPATVHAPAHTMPFHMFVIGTEEMGIWKDVVALADFFGSQHIILHPGRDHTVETFQSMLDKIDDHRIMIENMAGLDTMDQPMFGQRMSDLVELRKIKEICFDFEKAVKAARYQNIPYKDYISEAMEKLTPHYFHISGGDTDNPRDEHEDIDSSDIDFSWIKQQLTSLSVDLVFETPKKDGLANDLKNIDYFRNLL
jgi:deoxyribonuclease-4